MDLSLYALPVAALLRSGVVTAGAAVGVLAERALCADRHSRRMTSRNWVRCAVKCARSWPWYRSSWRWSEPEDLVSSSVTIAATGTP